ncbi:hypothetical protein GALMADRAFT_244115 [Galerina marginata CBS 339.88]|uniref:Uncharacterized protein n=1 Tax=Galerina marginata (strain CBS 339.88) TaxID=685588 RepID=A0A067TI34_GALM3|nr:hypothetical protein GALMADRAFT_244115 [Galerina marginata CBS 339.88]
MPVSTTTPFALFPLASSSSSSSQRATPAKRHKSNENEKENALPPIKAHVYHHPTPPIVIVSQHGRRFDSLSVSDGSHYSNSDSGSYTEDQERDALRAGLKEAYDNFSKTVWTDESYSIEAVSIPIR